MASLGIIFQPSFPPERLRGVAQRAEAAGIEELWVFEDCFRESGIAALVAALAATDRLRIGVGILPMPLRNVAITAMELATIERLFPGRARFGVGHGVLDWMGQVGRRVASPLTLMREYVPALRALLAGEEVTVEGRYVRLDRVRLAWPPAGPVPVLAGAEGPRTLSLTGEVADGTVLTTGTSPEMTHDAVRRIREGRGRSGRAGDHEVVVFVNAVFGPTARADLEAELDRWGFTGGRRFGAAGDEDAVSSVVRDFVDAGAGTVLLQSRSLEPDLDAWIDAAGRVAARLR